MPYNSLDMEYKLHELNILTQILNDLDDLNCENLAEKQAFLHGILRGKTETLGPHHSSSTKHTQHKGVM